MSAEWWGASDQPAARQLPIYKQLRRRRQPGLVAERVPRCQRTSARLEVHTNDHVLRQGESGVRGLRRPLPACRPTVALHAACPPPACFSGTCGCIDADVTRRCQCSAGGGTLEQTRAVHRTRQQIRGRPPPRKRPAGRGAAAARRHARRETMRGKEGRTCNGWAGGRREEAAGRGVVLGWARPAEGRREGRRERREGRLETGVVEGLRISRRGVGVEKGRGVLRGLPRGAGGAGLAGARKLQAVGGARAGAGGLIGFGGRGRAGCPGRAGGAAGGAVAPLQDARALGGSARRPRPWPRGCACAWCTCR